jgi:hypothetical protein
MKDPWNPHWQALLGQLKPAVPCDWTVIVLSDRGLESAWLFGVITALGWHPLMRAKKGGKFRPKGWQRFYLMGQLVRQVGGSFAAEGRAYTGAELPCTLLACWGEGYDEPWLVLTDLPPEAGSAVWYALRAWIEQGFKLIKGGGWDWQKTRMDDPGRVERLWLVLAVATLWVVALGAEDEARERASEELKRLERSLSETEEQAQARRERERQRLERQRAALQERQERLRQRREAKKQAAAAQRAVAKRAKAAAQEGAARERTHRVSRRGLAVLKAAWERGQSPLPRHLYPDPWPEPSHSASTLTEQDFLSQPK